jgi:oxygen-independent coproporphyrinogen-3 oxidase
LAGQDQFMGQYHNALIKEVRTFAYAVKYKKNLLHTLFFGGGTPSTYPNNLLTELIGTLKDVFIFHQDIEITIEVNPGTVKEEQVKLWAGLGINRLSVGVQSLKDGALHDLNRLQTKQDVINLMSFATVYVENVSVDLIMGIPGVSLVEWQEYLHEIMSWPIKHISIYFLTVHEDTRLYFRVVEGKVRLPSDEYMIDCYQWTCAFLALHGFEQYELSNFAKNGYHSRHNSVYWDRKPYKAFGLGACSFDGNRRMQNEKNLTHYIKQIENDQEPVALCELLNDEQIRLEKAMLGLRRIKGACWTDMCAGLNDEKIKIVRTNVHILAEEGFIIFENDRVKLTQKGLLVENQIVSRLGL